MFFRAESDHILQSRPLIFPDNLSMYISLYIESHIKSYGCLFEILFLCSFSLTWDYPNDSRHDRGQS